VVRVAVTHLQDQERLIQRFRCMDRRSFSKAMHAMWRKRIV
jgi:hypothetical protein